MPSRILYCHCAYAQVIPPAVKEAVLSRLAGATISFEAVADLCEASARNDPSLKRLAAQPALKIVACFPRAVKWLFHAANAPLPPEATEVLNMRAHSADEIIAALQRPELCANLPAGAATVTDPKILAQPPAEVAT